MNLKEAMAANRNALDHITQPDLKRLLPILRQAEKETGAKLGHWLYEQSPDDRYDMHRHRSLLYQLRKTIDLAEDELGPALATDLTVQGRTVMTVAMNRLGNMIQAGDKQYLGTIRPLRLDVASVIGGGERWAKAKFPIDGSRYGKTVADDIKNRLMLGVVKGETIDQLTSRLLQSTGLIKYYKERGPSTSGQAISSRLFKTYKSSAETTARTALIDAYNEVQARGIRQADKEDPGWLKEWDAANDMRTCLVCARLDKLRRAPDKEFPGRLDHPPAHRRCRCAVAPVHESWL